MLKRLREEPPYAYLEEQVAHLAASLRDSAAAAGVAATVNQVGSMFTVFFTDQPVTDFTSAKASDAGRYARFFWAMLERGVYLPPSQFEAAFASAALTPDHFDAIIAAAREAFVVVAAQ
jgi:glutamate-1-semialdehyde 2,1-aminomutase